MFRHDAEANILAIQDLGGLVTLWDFFAPIEDLVADSPLKPGVDDICTRIGKRLGGFFARLHAPITRATLIDSLTQTESKLLTHTPTRKLVRYAAVEPIFDRLESHNVSDAEELARRVEEDFLRKPVQGESCFSLGDFHPDSILVSPLYKAYYKHKDPIVAVIDWEFAGLDCQGANGDMAQFLACFQCYLLDVKTERGGTTDTPVHKLVDSVMAEYAKFLTFHISKSKENADELSLVVLRSALILHGREIINQAVDGEWKAGDCAVAEMVKTGAELIRLAQDSVASMKEENNWTKIMREDVGAFSILKLFGVTGQ